MEHYPIESLEVASTYQAIPADVRKKLLAVRQMIFEISGADDKVGEILETLKWGVPSYLTERPKSGTTIRLQWSPAQNKYGIYVHCQTSLIPLFREQYPSSLHYEKNRGILFEQEENFPENLMKEFIIRALTYHVVHNKTESL